MAVGKLACRPGKGGFTYIAMLFALAIFGLGLAALGQSWAAVSHRDKEDELLKIVSEYMHAINSYYVRSPGTPKTFALRLEDLIEDRRFVGTVRHLRRVYRDPMTGQAEWGLIKNASGGIVGIYSLSNKDTLRQQGLTLAGSIPVLGTHYSDWKFTSALIADPSISKQPSPSAPTTPAAPVQPPIK